VLELAKIDLNQSIISDDITANCAILARRITLQFQLTPMSHARKHLAVIMQIETPGEEMK
jgi:hypothetical protein